MRVAITDAADSPRCQSTEASLERDTRASRAGYSIPVARIVDAWPAHLGAGHARGPSSAADGDLGGVVLAFVRGDAGEGARP